MLYLGIMLAGGSGALLRFALGRMAVNMGWTALPFGTLAANVVGCFLMGYLAAVMSARWEASENMQIIVFTGFLGGFTTFSAFSYETLSLLQNDGLARASVYLLLSVGLCLLACLAGLTLGRQ